MSDDDIENDFDLDDFDSDDGFDDGGFDDFNDKQGTLGDLWRNNPIIKFVIIGGVVVFLLAGFLFFGEKTESLPASRVSTAREVNEAPGSGEVSETIRQAVEEENVRRTEEAMRNSGSVMPMPIDPPKGVVNLQLDETEEEDPLERWRRMQQERIAQQQIQDTEPENPTVPAPEPVDTRTPAIDAMSQAMAQQMASILEGIRIDPPLYTQITSVEYLENLREQEVQKATELERLLTERGRANELEGGGTAAPSLDILLPAGTIEYGQLVTEANTDAPGPILAQVVSGPLRGSRLIGSFQATNNYLTLNFNTVVIDGIDYKADAVAIDPNTTLPGVVTDINRRYFTRVFLPAAAEFIEGFTEAIAESGTTTITINNADGTTTESTSNPETDNDQEVASGVEAAGEELSDILDEIADDTEPLLRVRAGTPIGILFVSSVTGTPQVLEDQEQEAFERERSLLQLPSGFNNLQQQQQ